MSGGGGEGGEWKQWQTLFSWAPKLLWTLNAAMKLKDAPWKKSYDKPRWHIKKLRHYFVDKDPYSQSYGFSSSHIQMWELDHKEGWMPKNWCFQTVVPEKILENPLNSKEIKPINPKGNQSWIFIGSTDAEAEAPVLWSPDAQSQLIGKDPDAGKDWRQEDGGTTEDEMFRWHHWFNGHKFEQTPGDSKGQGNMACCSPWSHKESGVIEWVNNNKNIKRCTIPFQSST